MPAPTQAAPERVNAFPIENTVLVKHYFDGDDVFARLRPSFNGREYRFEVPAGEFDSLRRFLLDHGYELTDVEDPVPFYAVVRQYMDHPAGIIKRSVRHERVDGYHCFLMPDRDAVEAMVGRGADRLTAKPLVLQYGRLSDFAPLSA